MLCRLFWIWHKLSNNAIPYNTTQRTLLSDSLITQACGLLKFGVELSNVFPIVSLIVLDYLMQYKALLNGEENLVPLNKILEVFWFSFRFVSSVVLLFYVWLHTVSG